MPKIGFSMNEGILTEWFVVDGGAVVEGKPLFAIESEKSVQEIDAPATGTLKIIGTLGETYEVGAVLGLIE
jgi:pyruvate/2-oxoglutarate dehydrogenase complex dihydrolipoamide acyltransferase (E2) component